MIRFDDGASSYSLEQGTMQAGMGPSEREIRQVLARWLSAEPWRTQLRMYIARELRVEARTDDALIDRICALREVRGLRLVRAERMGLWDPSTQAEASELAGESLSTLARKDAVRDWKYRCEHEIDGEARTTKRNERLMVVPYKDDKDGKVNTDIIEILLRDDLHGPPASLTATPSGGSAVKSPDKGDQGGGYHAYAIPVAFLGDTSIVNFLRPAFWEMFNSRTTYTVTGASAPIAIDVMYPYEWTLSVSLPPLRSFKAGARLDESISLKEPSIKREVSAKFSVEDWAPSSQKKTTTTYESNDSVAVTPNTLSLESKRSLKHESGQRAFGGISLKRSDGLKVGVEELNLLVAIAKGIEEFISIIDAIKDAAPKVGWYVDLDVQFLQGTFSVAWGWREYEDHRAYRWIDVLIDMKLLSVALELGIGVEVGFKAQIYAKLEGEVKLAIEGQRSSPDGLPGLDQGITGSIMGSIGARFEVGNLLKIDAHGETGLKIELKLRLNAPSRIVACDLEVKWTGIRVSFTSSSGLFGIGGSKEYERELVSPKTIMSSSFPQEQKYNPVYISDERIESILEGVLTRGLNVRVVESGKSSLSVFGIGDISWPMKRIVKTLAARLKGYRTMKRDKKTIEGIAHSIRADLDELGARLLRDYVEARDFEAYVAGPKLERHLDDAIDLSRELLQNAGVQS
jgi:hypothetical protein